MHNLDAISTAAIVLSFLLTTVGTLWVTVLAFQKNLAWGFASILVPFAAAVFVTLHWDRAHKAAICNLAGIFLIVGTYCNHPNFRHAYDSRQAELETEKQVSKPAVVKTTGKTTKIASSHTGAAAHTTGHSGKKHHK